MDASGGFLVADPATIDAIAALAVALAIGLVIGLEREWSQISSGPAHFFAGARTFALTGLLGGASALVPTPIAAVAMASIAGLSLLAHSIAARDSGARGGTTEVALLLAFALGLLAGQGMTLVASAAGVATAGVLSMKSRIGAAAAALDEHEVRATLMFLAVTVIVLPVLPATPVEALGGVAPRAIWALVVQISGLSFAGYWLTKSFGARRGALMTGLVGGLASSTATTASLARLAAREPNLVAPAASGIVAANMVMLARLGAVVAVLSTSTFARLWLPLTLAAVVGAAMALRRPPASGAAGVSPTALSLTNPFELRPAVVFAGVLVLVSLLAERAADAFGDKGLYVLAALAGVADVDAISVSTLRLTGQEAGLSFDVAAYAIWIAAAVNMVAKACLAWAIGGRALALRAAPPLLLAAIAGGAAFLAL